MHLSCVNRLPARTPAFVPPAAAPAERLRSRVRSSAAGQSNRAPRGNASPRSGCMGPRSGTCMDGAESTPGCQTTIFWGLSLKVERLSYKEEAGEHYLQPLPCGIRPIAGCGYAMPETPEHNRDAAPVSDRSSVAEKEMHSSRKGDHAGATPAGGTSFRTRSCSSTEQSTELLTQRLQVRILPGAPGAVSPENRTLETSKLFTPT